MRESETCGRSVLKAMQADFSVLTEKILETETQVSPAVFNTMRVSSAGWCPAVVTVSSKSFICKKRLFSTLLLGTLGFLHPIKDNLVRMFVMQKGDKQ